MERFICIHAHFYQPPRENPWLEAVEQQDSAYPYHDWNARVTAECYAPNAAARILDGSRRIRQIVNNYAKISFNFGPTLLSWMKEKSPQAYRSILDSDHESSERFSGHGSALAQAYNHPILPLARARDKYTQILWGIRDFERRFGRFPEGLWLPETAVDLETLDILAQLGVKFTILAPHQAGKVRKIGGRSWKDVSGARIDPSRAYLAKLPSRRSINLFFYDGPVSQAVAFENLLQSGEGLVRRLEGGFSEARSRPQLMHIATDGETYGHHHRHGEMALAYALHCIESNGMAQLTNYGEFLEKFPPTHEVRIVENTAWSCIHGIERWRADCGCNAGHPGWNQQWRGPLRAALDYVRDRAAGLFSRQGGELFRDPWAARNGYIDVVLDRSPESHWSFFEEHSVRPLSTEETVKALKLLEMQRHAMLMYTSCGWFFDEISGTETVQILQYAGRVMQLAREIAGPDRNEARNEDLGEDMEPEFLKLLAEAKSNIPEFGDGAKIYEMWVKPAALDLRRVGAHFAVGSAFEDPRDVPKFCYDIKVHDHRRLGSGPAKLVLGHVRVSSQITRDFRDLVFGVVHLGDQVLHAGVHDLEDKSDYLQFERETAAAFSRGGLPETLRLLGDRLEGMPYSLKSLFKDEQRRILNLVLGNTLQEAEAKYREIYRRYGPVRAFLKDMNQPGPEVLRITAEFVVNNDLKHALEANPVDSVHLAMLMDLAKGEDVKLEETRLSFAARNAIARTMRQLQQQPQDRELLEQACALVTLLRMLPFRVDYWEAQNIFYSMLQEHPPVRPEINGNGTHGNGANGNGANVRGAWRERFLALGEQLQVSVPDHEAQAELKIAG